MRLKAVGDSLSMTLDGSSLVTGTDSTYTGAGYFSIEETVNRATLYDWLFIRPYDGVDPAVTVGSEVIV